MFHVKKTKCATVMEAAMAIVESEVESSYGRRILKIAGPTTIEDPHLSPLSICATPSPSSSGPTPMLMSSSLSI
jgi:hypothetical protein